MTNDSYTFIPGHEKMETSVSELFQLIEKNEGHPVYRHIQVNFDGFKKTPIGEKNNMSIEQIKDNRGNKDGNTLSLSVKHVDKLYVIDFDTKDLDKNELKQFLDLKQNLFIETKKGYHYYIFIEDMIDYSNQQKIYKDETADVDLIKTNNIWETKTRKAYGTYQNINVYNWVELSKFFDETKMNKSKQKLKPKEEVKDEGIILPSNDTISNEDVEKIKTALKFLDVKRANNYTDWVNVGIALYNQGNDSDGKHFELWNEFSQRSDKYAGLTAIFKKYQTFSSKQQGLTIKSIFYWLKEDNPEEFRKLCVPQNKYHQWFMKGPSEFMKQMNKEICFYPGDSIYFYYPKPDWLVMNNKTKTKEFYDKYEFKISDKDKEGKFITINPFDFWYKNIERREIRGIVMKPNQDVSDEYFNLWSGYKYQNKGKCNIDKVQHFINHIKDVWANGDEEIGEYLLNWLAQIIQYPERKTEVCVVLKSIEGVGKTIILDMIGQIMGKEYYQSITKMGEALGRFNKILEKKILVNFNETNWGGDKKMAGSFKSIITDKTINIEGKGLEPYTTDNLINCIITTNEDWIAQVSSNDRRFFMVECKEQKLGNDGINKLLKTDLQELANFLYNRDISDFNPRSFKITEMKEDQIIRNFNSVENFFFNINEGDVSIHHLKTDDDDETFTIIKEHLYKCYLENTNGKHDDIVNIVQFWKKVRKIFPLTTYKTANKIKKSRVIFPSYEYLLETINKYSKSK